MATPTIPRIVNYHIGAGKRSFPASKAYRWPNKNKFRDTRSKYPYLQARLPETKQTPQIKNQPHPAAKKKQLPEPSRTLNCSDKRVVDSSPVDQ